MCFYENNNIIIMNTKLLLNRYCRIGNLDGIKNFASSCPEFDNYKDHALIEASQHGHLNIVVYLVNLGANIHANNDCAVRQASFSGHLDIIKYLVDLGANVRADNDQAIRWVCASGELNVIKYLLLRGAYHQRIKVNFDVIKNLYSSGHFDVIHKLINNDNCTIGDNQIDQFNDIKKSVDKIIDLRKWNSV